MLLLIAAATFAATLLGGQLALRFRDQLHLILGFSAGAVIGVAFFDLLPEALELGGSPALTCTLVAGGFLAYLILDRLAVFHAHHHGHMHEECSDHEHHEHHERDPDSFAVRPRQTERCWARLFGAASLSLHSFLDGVAIGLAFQVAAPVGFVVAFAVLAHDFSDGINTVSFLLRGRAHDSEARRLAFRWLLTDALAPPLGIAATLLVRVEPATLGAILALFTGFFIYIGASELIPESYHSHPKALTTLMTVLGLLTMFGVIKLAGV
jgi:ZIP family zinc transporter